MTIDEDLGEFFIKTGGIQKTNNHMSKELEEYIRKIELETGCEEGELVATYGSAIESYTYEQFIALLIRLQWG